MSGSASISFELRAIGAEEVGQLLGLAAFWPPDWQSSAP